MSEEDLRKYFNIYTECWQLFKDHSNPDGTMEFWSALNAEAKAIYKKYNGMAFALEMTRVALDEIQRIESEGKNDKS